jgi:hypothetical protein
MKMILLSIGDAVIVTVEDSKEVFTISDIAYMGIEGSPTTEANGGELSYELEGYGWVPAHLCKPEVDKPINHWEHLGRRYFGWTSELEPLPDNSNIPPVVTLLMAIQYDKEKYYGSSWKGKGEYRGIMSNIDRKYDRLDKITQDEINGKLKSLAEWESNLGVTVHGDDVPESKIDAVADLTNYGILYMTYLREKFPKMFNVWVKKNLPAYLADNIPFLKE